MFYDAPGSDLISHVHCDIEIAWLDLPLIPPDDATIRESR